MACAIVPHCALKSTLNSSKSRYRKNSQGGPRRRDTPRKAAVDVCLQLFIKPRCRCSVHAPVFLGSVPDKKSQEIQSMQEMWVIERFTGCLRSGPASYHSVLHWPWVHAARSALVVLRCEDTVELFTIELFALRTPRLASSRN